MTWRQYFIENNVQFGFIHACWTFIVDSFEQHKLFQQYQKQYDTNFTYSRWYSEGRMRMADRL
ncbi:hypothetical protein BDZ91DRAFT_730645 [Kalaharituber pfeilii]|nr:hypothetical protein BDZ91DRAFT_730645 [Kalaharituber pfeilii]